MFWGARVRKLGSFCFPLFVAFLIVSVLLAGCGGRGAGSSSGITGSTGGGGVPQQQQQTNATAFFHVDVKTGNVSVTRLTGTTLAPAIFQGNSIGFTTSTLIDQTGDVGRKALSVSLVNHSGETIGVNPNSDTTGLKVIFSPITSLSAGTLPPLKGYTTVESLVPAYSFSGPVGVAVGKGGAVYVADDGANKIIKVSGHTATVFAGNGTAASVDGGGTSASFNHPFGIAYNSVDGSLIVTDDGGNKVRRITSTGRVTTIAGTGAAGGTNGAANTATFESLEGVAVDNSGNIYVCDGSCRIRLISLIGADPSQSTSYTVTTFAGGSVGHQDGLGTSASFDAPLGVACDSAGNVYVADTGNNLIRFIQPTGEVSTIAGSLARAEKDGIGIQAELSGPAGLAVSGNALYVADYDGLSVRQVTLLQGASPSSASSWAVQTLAGDNGSGNVNGSGSVARFNGPLGLAANGSQILVGGYADKAVREVIPDTGYFPIGTANSTGSNTAPVDPVELENATGVIPNNGGAYISYSGSLTPGASSTAQSWLFSVPNGVTAFEFTVSVEADTELYAAVEAAVGGGSPQNQVRTLAGSGSSGFETGSGSIAGLSSPCGCAVDAAGVTYVVDQNYSCVLRIDTAGNVTLLAGVPEPIGGASKDGTGLTAVFNSPSCCAVNPTGTEVFVGDQFVLRVCILSPGTDPTNPANWTTGTVAGSAGNYGDTNGLNGSGATFNFIYGLAYAPGGIVYLSEAGPGPNHDIRYVDFVGGNATVSSNYQVGTLAGSTQGDLDAQGTSAQFNGPTGLAVDLAGNVYVADTGNNRIRKITPSGSVSTLAGGPSGVNENPGYQDGSASTARFNQPNFCAVDGAGYVYVTDRLNTFVRRVSPAGNVETVAGVYDTLGNKDGAGNTATFNNLNGIAVTPSGNLVVADGSNNNMRLIERVLTSGATTPSRK